MSAFESVVRIIALIVFALLVYPLLLIKSINTVLDVNLSTEPIQLLAFASIIYIGDILFKMMVFMVSRFGKDNDESDESAS